MSLPSFKTYLSLEKQYSPHTVEAYERDLLEFTAFCQEQHQMEHIEDASYPLIRQWIVTLVNRPLSNRTVNRKLASLKAYYRFLLRIHRIKQHPMAKHKALKTAKKVEVPFSEREMEIMLNDIPFEDDFEGLRDRLIIELFYTTGMRRAELMGLQLSDVDLQRKTVKVLGKRNKERIIPLLDRTISLFYPYLDARKRLEKVSDERHIFLSKSGNKIYETLVYRIINGYFSKVSSKLKKSPHILRHTFATHLLSKGADLNSVKELLGHSSLASTQVYTHNSIAELKKAHTAHPRNKG